MTQPIIKRQPRNTDAVRGGNPAQPIATAAVIGGTAALDRPTRTLTTAKGQSVDTPLTDPHALAIFSGISSKKDFILSLQSKLKNGKNLTPDQMVWVHIFAIEELQEKTLVSLEVENSILVKIHEMLEGASANLKFPKIRLASADREIITLLKCSENSRHPGSIGIYAADRKCLGRIERLPESKSAVFRKEKKCPEWVETTLLHFAGDPVAGAKTFATLTGNCCFCNSALTDDRSVSEGYGPICARRYNLPWGDDRR